MRHLAGAAAEGESADAADRAGMAVRHRMRRARQHDAELRRHHVGNALLRIVDVEKSYAVLARALAHRPQERRAGRIGVVIAAGLGGDGVVLHGESQIGPVDRPALLLQRGKCMMRMQFVQHVPVDIEQVAAIGALSDQVRIPDFVEQSARHGVGPGADGLC